MTIAELRKTLDKIDAELLRLAKQRLDVVEEISREKLQSGSSLFDADREREVHERSIHTATALGLDSSVAQNLMQVLIDAAHAIQERAESQARNKVQDSERRRFVIIGGRGQMGKLLGDSFSQRGHQVDVLEKGDLINPNLIREAEIVLIAVPMHLAVEVSREVARYVSDKALLTDINSLKKPICEIYSEHVKGEAMSLHPMFGPSVTSFRRQKMILVPVRRGPIGQWLTTELGRMGFDLVETDAEGHDQMMAMIQVLTHFHTIVAGEAMRKSGISIKDTLNFVSPIYRLELAVIGRLFAQDPNLYAEIEIANPAGRKLRQGFVEAASAFNELINEGNRKLFREKFLAIRDYFQDFSDEAMELSNEIIDAIVRKP